MQCIHSVLIYARSCVRYIMLCCMCSCGLSKRRRVQLLLRTASVDFQYLAKSCVAKTTTASSPPVSVKSPFYVPFVRVTDFSLLAATFVIVSAVFLSFRSCGTPDVILFVGRLSSIQLVFKCIVYKCL